MRFVKKIQGQISHPCPSAVLLKDVQGEFFLREPCGQADCVCEACRKVAELRRARAAERAVPDVFPAEWKRTVRSC